MKIKHTPKLRATKVNKPRPLHVTIEVLGGVAEVTKCPKGVIVSIIDHDNH